MARALWQRSANLFCRRTFVGACGAGAILAGVSSAGKTSGKTQVIAQDHSAVEVTRGKWGIHRPSSPSSRQRDAVLVVSDLDGTLVGDDGALRQFNRHWLSQQLAKGSVIVYNTARDLPFFQGLLHDDTWGKPELLRPDALILSEGTQIWHFEDERDEPRLDTAWRDRLRETWDASMVATECDKYNKAELVPGFIQDNELRRTVFVEGGAHASAEVTAALRNALGPAYDFVDMECWQPGVRMITVMPAAAGKGNAAEYIRSSFKFSPEKSMWAGDTRGDASMLRTSLRGVLVGNASAELRADAALATMRDMGMAGRIHSASASHAGGVLEGLRKHGME